VISHFNENVIFQAGKYEFDRGGQLFFIHNRVDTIEAMGHYL
jgi:transcription-repair coupling factor (superfamily II helicase)